MIFDLIEDFCPPGLAEEWDNCGLQAGDPEKPASRVLLALDMDEEVLSEAVEKEAGLVVTHHPLLLKGIRQIREDRHPGRLLARIIRSGITVYAAHTNLDSAARGVSAVLAEKLDLTGVRVLRPGGEKFLKLAVFVPPDHVDAVREALAQAGAGWIGNYSHCTFTAGGTGTFRPLAGANPYIGRVGNLEKVEEARLETILPARLAGRVLETMFSAHPYEEVAYDLYPLENRPENTGIGRLGRLQAPLPLGEFAQKVREALGVPAVRSGGPAERLVNQVAVCGGSGGDLWPLALAGGADVLVTGDIGYHGARDMLAAGMCFVDAGHYGTERVILDPLAGHLRDRCREKGLDVEIIVSSVHGDPYTYV
ncbi:MAG: Nif3-like dinuclear metal center hexameric protein [Peptococcaceae bacterium]|nr:Nif3-like dinuclear metal center hexameric protein [Peptococcaceae bacterium]